MSRVIGNKSSLLLLTAIFLCAVCCNQKSADTPKSLPKDLLGIRVGMLKADAQKRLEEIAVFESDRRKRQEIWQLKDDPHFLNLAVGYTPEERIRYITAFVDKEKATERIKFTEVGDISKAKAEITGPHYRYIWELPASDGTPAYKVILYGDNPDFVSFYTLIEKVAPAEEEKAG